MTDELVYFQIYIKTKDGETLYTPRKTASRVQVDDIRKVLEQQCDGHGPRPGATFEVDSPANHCGPYAMDGHTLHTTLFIPISEIRYTWLAVWEVENG